MITYIENSNLLDSKADVLINPVNCEGVMGKGLALEFKRKYPEMFVQYKQFCTDKILETGWLHWWFDDKNRQYIVNFPTKDKWRKPSKLEYIESGLYRFSKDCEILGFIQSAAFPRLGCGAGGLLWTDVKPLMERYLEPLKIISEIYV